MVMNSFGTQKFHAANGKAQHALMMGPVFFFLRGWVEVIFYFTPCSQRVLTMFPKGSQVSKCVPLDVPNGTWVLSHMVGRTYELISINHTVTDKTGEKQFLKQKPLQKYIHRDGLPRSSN